MNIRRNHFMITHPLSFPCIDVYVIDHKGPPCSYCRSMDWQFLAMFHCLIWYYATILSYMFHCKSLASPIHRLRRHSNEHRSNDVMEQYFQHMVPVRHNKSSVVSQVSGQNRLVSCASTSSSIRDEWRFEHKSSISTIR